MKKKQVIFSDRQIIDFCSVTKDTNEIHDPAFMKARGKRVIVPGMFALATTVNLSADFLKNRANSIFVHFNSLLSSGDFVTLCNTQNPDDPNELRLSAINQKDTLGSRDEYSKLFLQSNGSDHFSGGILRALEVNPSMVSVFTELTGGTDTDVSRFLFAVAYASQALLKSIDNPVTEVEKEIDDVINRNSKVSPFYQTLEINFPSPFPSYFPEGLLEYYIDFTVEKPRKLYIAHLRCEHAGKILFYSKYKLAGIPDMMIYRMAKEISHPRRSIK